MATPSSPISFSDIYSEANGSTPGSPTLWGSLARDSYFDGPNASGGNSFNGWGGYGSTSGSNRIFQIPADSTPNFGSYRNKTYFYGNAPDFDITLLVDNQTAGDIDDVNITLYDNSLTYNYVNGTSGPVGSTTTYGPSSFQGLTPNTPLIEVLYWIITVSTPPFFPGGTMDYYINGNIVLSGAPVNPGPAPNIFDFSAGSTESTRNSIGFTGSYHEVYIV
jgi:hypothetical protein